MPIYLLNGLVDLVAPPRCPACETVLPLGVPVSFCNVCAVTLTALNEGPAALEYGGAIVQAIQRFKYGRRSELAVPLAALMMARGAPLGRSCDVVVAVPLHRVKRIQRGFDQARLLAARLANQIDLPHNTRTLQRIRNTRSQAGLVGAERRQNMTGAFFARQLPGSPRVLLVDDVHTTGATMRAARTALLEAGAKRVHCLALAASL